jgi:hypothetical protein
MCVHPRVAQPSLRCVRDHGRVCALSLCAVRDAVIALLMRGVNEASSTHPDDPALGQRLYVLRGSMLPALLDMFED